jgi:hypothetical protein
VLLKIGDFKEKFILGTKLVASSRDTVIVFMWRCGGRLQPFLRVVLSVIPFGIISLTSSTTFPEDVCESSENVLCSMLHKEYSHQLNFKQIFALTSTQNKSEGSAANRVVTIAG